MKIRGAALLAAGALVLAGCGGGDDTASGKKGTIAWSKAQLVQQLRTEAGIPNATKVTCKAGLPAEEGAKTTCTASAEGDSATYTVEVEPSGETGAVAPVFTGEGGAPAMEQDYPEAAESVPGVPDPDEYDEPVTEEDSGMYAYGETVPGEEQDVKLSAPKRVKVSSDDAMMCDNDPAAYFEVTVTSKNTSSKPIDMASTLMISGTSGDKPACDVDVMGDDQMATILPGKTGTATMRFGVQDASAPLTIEVSEASAMESVYFTNDPSAA